MNVPVDHSFGMYRPPEPYGVGELIHYRTPDNYQRGKEKQSSLVAFVRHHLKKANYQNFGTLLQAFEFYDKVRISKTIST